MSVRNIDEAQRILFDALTQKKMELTISPTEKCNFRCSYCYEDFSIGKMKRPVIDAIKNFISERSPELERLSISWFGGEPLLAIDTVIEISKFSKNICNYRNIEFNSNISTNGYLLNADKIIELVDSGVRLYQITLDGDDEYHNSVRIRLGGGGSFSKIWENLMIFQDLYSRQIIQNFQINLRVHVHKNNIESIISLSELIENSMSSEIFSVHLKPIADLSNSGSDDVASHSDYKRALEVINKRLSRFYIQGEGDVAVCYASKPNAFFIRPTGVVSKCTVDLNNDRNNVGKIMNDGSLELDVNKIKIWTRGLKSMDSSELSCPLYNIDKISNVIK